MSVNFSCAAIFCDDIRHELNGKVSLMGIYTREMNVPDFPIMLPKICAYFELRIQPDYNCSEATLTVMKGAEKISSITMAIPSLDDSDKTSHGKPFAYRVAGGALEFPSMTFNEPTLMEILAQIDGQVVVAGRLWVTTFPTSGEIDSSISH